MTKKLSIYFDNKTDNINLFSEDPNLSIMTQVMMLRNALGYLIYKQCKLYNKTKEQRTEILETIFKDMEDQFFFMEKEEE